MLSAPRLMSRAGGDALTYSRSARNPRSIALVAGYLGVLAWLWIAFGAAPLAVALLSIPALPALWEIARGTRSGLSVSADGITWYSGRRRGHLPLSDIEQVQLNTSWDFAIRMVIQPRPPARPVRLPWECTPPRAEIEEALKASHISVIRHHFIGV